MYFIELEGNQNLNRRFHVDSGRIPPMSDEGKSPQKKRENKFMSDGEREWLSDHWHHVNDIGDADEREEWRHQTRLRRLGIDPDSGPFEILEAIAKLKADEEEENSD